LKEYLDVVTENGILTGETIDRETAHLTGIWHRTSHLWLLRKKNNAIQVLLQKRAALKSFPGCYDISSAGHIPAGEDYIPSALRELREELGISAEAEELICCGDRTIIWDDVFFGKPYHDRQYTRVFFMWKELEETEFRLQEEEVESVCWMELDQCIKGVEKNLFPHCIEPEELMMVKQGAGAFIALKKIKNRKAIIFRN